MNSRRITALIAVSLMTAILFAEEEKVEKPKSGFGLAPGMTVSSNVPIGVDLDSKVVFEIHNYSKTLKKLSLKVTDPKAAGLLQWEKGYEPIPDVAWCRLEKDVVEVSPESVSSIKAFIKIPKDDKNYNRKFMVAVACEPHTENVKGTGIVLRMVSRWGIETEVSKDIDAQNAGGSLAMIPAILRTPSKSGVEYAVNFKVRNNNPTPVTLKHKTLSEVEPDQEKHDRYFGVGRDPVNDHSWLVALEPITLAPGETKEVALKVKVPATAQAGKIFEELLFLENEKKELEFVRIRTSVDK